MYRYIFAMSKYDREIRSELCDKSKQLDKHLIKLALYPRSEYCPGWRKEIFAFINDVDRLKRTKRFPKKSFILDALCSHLDIIENFTAQVKSGMRHANIVPQDLSCDDLRKIIMNYSEWLADNLSSRGYVTEDDVLEKLDQMNLSV